MEEEMNKAEVDDIIQMKSPPWLMFAAKHNNSRKAISSEANDSTVTEVIEKKGGVALSIEHKSSMPKLPPINLNCARVPLAENYEKLKGIFLYLHMLNTNWSCFLFCL